MPYRAAILLLIGGMVTLTLGVAAFEIFQASTGQDAAGEPRNHLGLLIQIALLYGAFICVGGAMDCFLVGKSGGERALKSWPENLSDDEVGHGPDRGTAYKR